MPQHFIKIEIKGESDLPKEVGRYETCCKGDLRYVYWEGTPDDKDYWMLNVDYYFLPVPEPQQPEQTRIERHELEIKLVGIIKGKLGTSNYVPGVVEASKEIAELFASQSPSKAVISDELNEKQKYLIEITAMLLGACILTKDEIISELTKHAKLILENASQSYEAVIMPTDQDVEKECKKRYVGNLAPTYFKECAKWFRSQVREVELKGELERIIIDFINGRFKTILFSTASKKEVAKLIVDDYLSARKEEK